MSVDLTLIAKSLALRLRDMRAVLERYDSFVFRPPRTEVVATGWSDDEAAQVSKAVVLRALRTATDPALWRILELLDADDATTAALAARVGCPRLVAWDQVNELLQVGLVNRDIETDRVGLTAAGAGVVEMVHALTAAVEEVHP